MNLPPLPTLTAPLWQEYATIFHTRWGLTPEVSYYIGHIGNALFDAEFSARAARAYNDSVILPIRNAYYAAQVTLHRWKHLSRHLLREPILDYGCGVGFLLLWLQEQGYSDLWGYELPGVQCSILQEVLTARDLSFGLPSKPGTVLCFNVLEHQADPEEFLARLRALGGQLYANCDLSERPDHLAPEAARRAVVASLKATGEWEPLGVDQE